MLILFTLYHQLCEVWSRPVPFFVYSVFPWCQPHIHSLVSQLSVIYQCFKMVLVPGLQYWKMNCRYRALLTILPLCSAPLLDHPRLEYR